MNPTGLFVILGSAALAAVGLGRRLGFTRTAASVGLGFAALFPAAALVFSLGSVVTPPLIEPLWRAFVVAALAEESVKAAAILLAFSLLPPADHRAAVASAGLVGLGFAVFESLFYATASPGVVILRSTLAVPVHVCCGLFIGYHAGLARFYSRSGAAPGVAAAVILHGAYDFCILAGLPLAYAAPFLVGGACLTARSLWKKTVAA